MYCRLPRSEAGACPFELAAVSLLAIALGGCTQATRHSNLMVFGTNTVVGLSAGKDVDTPAITVGYKRQELVLMPLVANEKENGSRELVPCEMNVTARTVEKAGQGSNLVVTGQTETVAARDFRPDHPCLLAAVRSSGNDHVAKDSYSVLASFGANFDSGVGTEVRAKGGLAQYFATGMAAQLLAASGGAAVVATGPAAEVSAATKPAPAVVAAIAGDAVLTEALANPSIADKARKEADANEASLALARDYLTKIPDDNAFRAEIDELDREAGLDGNLSAPCKILSRQQCLDIMGATFAGRDAIRIARVTQERSDKIGGVE